MVNDSTSHADLPLHGVRVLEIASWIAGPACGRILREWGAEVVKVEPLGGDALRGMGNPARIPDVSPPFELTNAGKKSVALNLRSAESAPLLRRLVMESDVVLTNLRPSARKALNLDYDDIADYAPAVVFCVISGYGFEGPESERPGFDWAAYWAAAGIGSAISEGYEVPIAPRPAIGDHSTAMSAAAGVCAALVARAQTGRGQQVHTSLVANGAFQLGWDYANLAWVGEVAPGTDRRRPTNPLNNSYQCKSGDWLVLVNLRSDLVWEAFCGALGVEHLLAESAYSFARGRAEHGEELVREFDAAFARFERSDIGRRLDQSGIVWAPLRTVDEAMAASELDGVAFQDCDFNSEPRRVSPSPVQFWAASEVGGWFRNLVNIPKRCCWISD